MKVNRQEKMNNTMNIFEKKAPTVLVTGATGGIGSAIARLFASRGYATAIHYNKNESKALEIKENLLSSGFSAEIFQADLTSPEAVRKMVSEIEAVFGTVDVLVNNAGISLIKLFDDTSDEEWDNIMNVNLKSAFLCSKAVAAGMIHNKKGKIINISSIWGVKGASCEVAYSASKAGLIGFTKALAQELAPSNIQVNCVAPGAIATEMNSHLSATEIKELCQEIPAGRFGAPIEVAESVWFLANSSYVTGQVLGVDGGWK